jgi:hypothetical protein
MKKHETVSVYAKEEDPVTLRSQFPDSLVDPADIRHTKRQPHSGKVFYRTQDKVTQFSGMTAFPFCQFIQELSYRFTSSPITIESDLIHVMSSYNLYWKEKEIFLT